MEQTLGKRIMHHRKRMGLTQDQLAEKCGVTAQAVSKWENDQSCPDINMLPRLAELFGRLVAAKRQRTKVPPAGNFTITAKKEPASTLRLRTIAAGSSIGMAAAGARWALRCLFCW